MNSCTRSFYSPFLFLSLCVKFLVPLRLWFLFSGSLKSCTHFLQDRNVDESYGCHVCQDDSEVLLQGLLFFLLPLSDGHKSYPTFFKMLRMSFKFLLNHCLRHFLFVLDSGKHWVPFCSSTLVLSGVLCRFLSLMYHCISQYMTNTFYVCHS